jgi:hypothetical protein
MNDCPHSQRMNLCWMCVEEIMARVMVRVLRSEIQHYQPTGATEAFRLELPMVCVDDVRAALEDEIRKVKS